MPLDVGLDPNTPTATLLLREAQPLPDRSGYAALLVVRSGGFAAALPFFVAGDALEDFAAALTRLVDGGAEPAMLRARDGDDAITLRRTPAGVEVSGELHEVEGDQSLRFFFVTTPASVVALGEGVHALASAAGPPR